MKIVALSMALKGSQNLEKGRPEVMTYWTDYPFVELGDEPGKEAPIRKCDLISYDQDKYVMLRVEGVTTDIKSGYVYTRPGRCGEVPSVSRDVLHSLPVTTYEN
jgi:hypothetical protein